MACSMDMLFVVKLAAPKGPIPAGMKVTALSGPSGTPTKPGPVLAVGGFTLWPMSYDDNRMSMGMGHVRSALEGRQSGGKKRCAVHLQDHTEWQRRLGIGDVLGAGRPQRYHVAG